MELQKNYYDKTLKKINLFINLTIHESLFILIRTFPVVLSVFMLFRNEPRQLKPIYAPFSTKLSSPSNTLLSTACAYSKTNKVTIGVVERFLRIDERIQIPCSMSKSCSICYSLYFVLFSTFLHLTKF